MTVARILKSKGDDGVVTVLPTSTIGEAAAVLGTRRIGTVVVSSDGQHAEGILSERDIVRGLGQNGAACLSQPVTALMTPNPQTATASDLAQGALERMTEGRFRHMPVVEDGVLVGMISLGDVVKARLQEAEADREALTSMVQGGVA